MARPRQRYIRWTVPIPSVFSQYIRIACSAHFFLFLNTHSTNQSRIHSFRYSSQEKIYSSLSGDFPSRCRRTAKSSISQSVCPVSSLVSVLLEQIPLTSSADVSLCASRVLWISFPVLISRIPAPPLMFLPHPSALLPEPAKTVSSSVSFRTCMYVPSE